MYSVQARFLQFVHKLYVLIIRGKSAVSRFVGGIRDVIPSWS